MISCRKEPNTETQNTYTEREKTVFSIIIHGGAGTLRKENLSLRNEAAYREKLEEAIGMLVAEFATARMFRATMNAQGNLYVGTYKKP